MKAALRLLATLLLLSVSATAAEAGWAGACSRVAVMLPAPAEHSHALPGDDGHGAPPPAPAGECPMPMAGHGGCATALLPALPLTGEFLPSIPAQSPVAPARAHGVLLVHDRFHPPRR